MGWFGKKEKEEAIPSLPKLPKLPEFPRITEEIDNKMLPPPSLNQLPSFPNSPFGQKFSQSTIKDAVTGRKEVGEDFRADDFVDEEDNSMRTMPKIPRFGFIKESSTPVIEKKVIEEPDGFEEIKDRVKKTEPIFIRIDKFEESLSLFDDIRKQVNEIDKMFGEVKKIKEKEEREFEQWEKELSLVKGQIEKIDRNVFSKIE